MDQHSTEKITYGTVNILRYKYAECDSTNDLALKHAAELQKNLIVRSDFQRKGKGTRGRTWSSEAAKNLCLSICLAQPKWTTHYGDYQFLSCLATLKAAQTIAPQAIIRVKYPNDIIAFHDNQWKKLAGILVETEIQAQSLLTCVCGVGCNVQEAPQDVDPMQTRACSLLDLCESQSADTKRALNIDAVEYELCSTFFALMSLAPVEIWSRWIHELDCEHLILEHKVSNHRFTIRNIDRSGIATIQSVEDATMEEIDSLREFEIGYRE